jgi:hypothetical protein
MNTPSPQFLVLETLEDRLVLSGLSDGTPVLKQLTYFDADGDKVSIKVTGKLPSGAGFQVSGAENGADLEEINLVRLGPKNDLVITVTPNRLAPSDLTTTNALFSPGYTNIGTISADSQSDNLNRPVDGATALRNLRLNAAVVSHINLPEVDIFGSLSLDTGRTAFVDRINTAAVQLAGAETSYNPSAGLIDLYDVTAKSLGGIQISGVAAALANNPSGLPGESKTNDINGAITVTGNLGGITARHSVLNGDVTVGGNLGLSAVGKFNGTVNVAGNLTAQLPASGADGLLAAGGHLNLGWQPGASGAGLSGVDIFAGAGISGLRASTLDTIIVPSGYEGTLTNTSTLSAPGTGVSDIRVIGGAAAFEIVSSNSVGDLRALRFAGSTAEAPESAGMKIEAGVGGIGSIISSAGGIDGTYRSAGNIGALSATGGAIAGNFEAVGNIGQITVSTPNTNGVSGQINAGGSITGVQVTIATLGGGEAIAEGAQIEAGTSLGPVVVNSLAKDQVAIAGSLLAGNGITSVNITAASTVAALAGTINADQDGNGTGSLPALTVTNNGTGTAATGATVKGASIGAAAFNVRTDAGSNATSGLTMEAGTGINFGSIASITASGGTLDGSMRATGNIGPVSVTGGALSGVVEAAGSIGQITVNTAKTDGITAQVTAGTSVAGVGVTISSQAGGQAIKAGAKVEAGTSIGAVVITSLSQGSVAMAGSVLAGNGITSVNITANSTAAALIGTINADKDNNGSGSLPTLVVTNNGSGTAATGATVSGNTLGALTFAASSNSNTATAGVTVEATNSIASIQATGNLTGATRFATTAAFSSIGPITGTGGGSQALQVATGNSGTVGAVTFASLGSGSSLDYNVGANVVSLGAITARGSSSSSVLLTGALTSLNTLGDVRADGTADLRNLKNGVSSLGAINAGTLILPSNLSNVTNLASLTASQVDTTAAVRVGANFGTAGAISIGNSATGGTNQQVTFGFALYTQPTLIAGTPLPSGGSGIGNFARL